MQFINRFKTSLALRKLIFVRVSTELTLTFGGGDISASLVAFGAVVVIFFVPPFHTSTSHLFDSQSLT